MWRLGVQGRLGIPPRPTPSGFVLFGKPSPQGFVTTYKGVGFVPHRLKGYSCVVVVHSCKLQGHIKHEWEGYLGDVGQSHSFVNKTMRTWLSKVDKTTGQTPYLTLLKFKFYPIYNCLQKLITKMS